VISLGRPTRLRLREVELGRGAKIRLRILIAIAGIGAALSIAALPLPFHEFEGELHTGLYHGGVVAAIPAVWNVVLAVAAWPRPTWGWLLAWAIAGTVAGLVATGVMVSMMLAHMFSDLPALSGQSLHVVGTMGQLLAPLLGLFGVPFEFLRTRKRLEALDPDGVPVARARARRR